MKVQIQVILGPTASGKTDLAIELAKKNGSAVISADSRQIYAGLDIGTAKPISLHNKDVHDFLEADLVDSIPHYLFNIATPEKQMSLSEWQASAKKVLAFLVSRGQNVVIAGGTMLYINSLLDWYDIPNVPPNEPLRASLEEKPTHDLYAQLIKQDPAAQKFIEPHHKRRIIRALEVMTATNQPFSISRTRQLAPYDFSVTGLFPRQFGGQAGWDNLRERIEKRIEDMLKTGLLEETRRLQTKHGATLPLLQTMNYKQATQVLAGQLTNEEAIAEMIRVNMRYAHRQMSWWKRRTDIHWQ